MKYVNPEPGFCTWKLTLGKAEDYTLGSETPNQLVKISIILTGVQAVFSGKNSTAEREQILKGCPLNSTGSWSIEPLHNTYVNNKWITS